jgi:hypothetical protein
MATRQQSKSISPPSARWRRSDGQRGNSRRGHPHASLRVGDRG